MLGGDCEEFVTVDYFVEVIRDVGICQLLKVCAAKECSTWKNVESSKSITEKYY